LFKQYYLSIKNYILCQAINKIIILQPKYSQLIMQT